MLKIPTKEELYRRIRAIVRQEIQSVGPVQVQATGASGVSKGIIPAAYVSGNPKIQQAHESATSLGSKTYKVTQPISNRFGALAASDSIAYGYDPDGNKGVLGKFADVASVIVDADYIMGLRPVAPGNTLLLSHDAEVNTTSATYVDTANKFQVTRPGLYRLKVELARSAGTNSVRAIRKLKDGSVVALTAALTQTTLTYPTYGAVQSTDFTSPVDWGDVIYVQMLNDSSFISYMKNCRIYYTDSTASITPYDAAL